ncbi:hypothetical protein BOX15_Mlig009620g1, partial [Macrostomum lignano]
PVPCATYSATSNLGLCACSELSIYLFKISALEMRSLFALQNEGIREKIRQFNVNFNFNGTPYRFEKFMGLGAYGLVCSATVADTGSRVAIKRLSDAFANEVVAKRAFREIKILRHLSHPNVVSLRGIFLQQSRQSCDVYLVLDYMPMDLNGFLKQRGALAFPDVKYIFYQLMCGLSCIHSIGVAHRDLKPSNLLINEALELKICDFGMSRHLTDTDTQQLTVYVATRRYRAPELLLKAAQYTTAVDIWSAGCVLGELLIGRPLFPGERIPDIVSDMAKLLGPLPPCLATLIDEKSVVSQANSGCQSLTELLAASSAAGLEAISLLLRMLNYDAQYRPTADEILHGNGNDSTGDFLASLRGTRPEAERLPMLPQLLDFTRLEASMQTCADLRAAIEREASEMSSLHAGASAAAAVATAAVPAEASAAATEAAKDAAASSFLQSLLQASPISSELSSSPQISPMSGCAAPPAPGSRDAAASGMSRGQILQRLQHRCSKLPSEPQPLPQEQLQGPPPQALHVPASTETPSSSPGSSLTNSISNAPSVAAASYSTVSPLPGGDDPMLCSDEMVVMETETGGFSLAGMLSPSVLELLSGISPMNCDQAMREFRQIWPIQPGDVDELMQLDETSACDAQLD